MKLKDLNNTVGLNISTINKSKDSTNLEILRTDLESRDIMLKRKNLNENQKETPEKNVNKNNETHDVSFAVFEKSHSPKNEEAKSQENQMPISMEHVPQPIENIDELVCEPSFCEENISDKPNSLKAKEDIENDVFNNGIFLIFLKTSEFKKKILSKKRMKENFKTYI